ncbi:hypothetical protein ACH5RR_012533 [Cinchona calisaya]|uniref:Uncharacterized protein n=1 Tax=Cinchona calisaya TaxID=153742 RepID=A0ABD3A828_9GENT
MDYLSKKIHNASVNNYWDAIKICNGGPSLSHCIFVDDIILFSKNTDKSIDIIKTIIHDFSSTSILTVNFDKSRIFFSKNSTKDNISSICNSLNTAKAKDLGLYLGFPITSRTRRSLFQFVLEKVHKKLAGWQTNLISFAGRKAIVQQVAAVIPAYYMQCTALPLSLCDDLDKLNIIFLWDSNTTSNKLSLFGREKVTCPKDQGGQGIRNTRLANKTALAKLIWRTINNDNSIWSCTLRSKYLVFDPSRTESMYHIKSGLGSSNKATLKRDLIAIVPLQWLNPDNDVLCSGSSFSGLFDSKEAYAFAHSLSSIVPHNSFSHKWIWKLKVSFKVKHLLWLALQDRLASKSLLHKRNIISDSSCLFCHAPIEDSEHILRSCPKASSLWASYNFPSSSFTLNYDDWLRNHFGDWLISFSRKIGISSNNTTYAWALRDGLQVAINKGCRQLIVESDSQILVDAVKSIDNEPHLLSPIICDYRAMMMQLNRVEVLHIFRDANFVADTLAKHGATEQQSFLLYTEPPPFAVTAFVNNIRAVTTSRLIHKN